MTDAIGTDIDQLLAVIDDVHALAHTLDGQATQLRALIEDGAKVVDTVRADIKPVEHVAGELYDAITGIGKDGFAEIVRTVSGLIGVDTPAPPAADPPTAGTATADVPEESPAPVAGTETPAPAEPAPVEGVSDPGAVPDAAAPGVQH